MVFFFLPLFVAVRSTSGAARAVGTAVPRAISLPDTGLRETMQRRRRTDHQSDRYRM